MDRDIRTSDSLTDDAVSCQSTEEISPVIVTDAADIPTDKTVSFDADTKSTSVKNKKKKRKKPKKKTTKQLAAGFCIKLGVIALVVWLLFTFVVSVTIQYGNNMFPAVRDGDFIISFKMQRPYINAAVVYHHDGKKYIGRVVAMGGNEVNISDLGEITVNGVIPSEEIFYATYRAENSGITYPYRVEEGKVFILNDFRSDSEDSRSFGAVDLKDVDGPILFSMRRRGF